MKIQIDNEPLQQNLNHYFNHPRFNEIAEWVKAPEMDIQRCQDITEAIKELLGYEFAPTDEQALAVYHLIRNNPVSISAIAGSGKTTLVLMALELLSLFEPNRKSILVTYSKALADETVQRLADLNSKFNARTLHSLLYRLARYLPHIKRNAVTQHFTEVKPTFVNTWVVIYECKKRCAAIGMDWKVLSKCVSEIFNSGFVDIKPTGKKGEVVKKLAKHLSITNVTCFYDEETLGEAISMIYTILKKFREFGTLPFEALAWAILYYDVQIPDNEKFEQIIVDETQDSFFAVLRVFKEKLLTHDGVMSGVHDSSQLIHVFSVSTSRTVELFEKLVGAKSTDLTWALRSPQYVCDTVLASGVKEVINTKNPYEGGYEFISPSKVVDEVLAWSESEHNAKSNKLAIVARTRKGDYSLLSYALKLLNHGILCHINLKDTKASDYDAIISWINKHKQSSRLDKLPIESLMEKWASAVEAEYKKKNKEVPMETVQSMQFLVLFAIRARELVDAPTNITYLGKLSELKETCPIQLLTMHQTKGLTFDTVIFTQPDTLHDELDLSGKFVWMRSKQANARELQMSEVYLYYVLVTRTSRRFIFTTEFGDSFHVRIPHIITIDKFENYSPMGLEMGEFEDLEV